MSGSHLIEGEFQSDKYPTCPRGKVPLSVKDPTAQDLLWEYAQRRRSVDAQFSQDLEAALALAGFRRWRFERRLHLDAFGGVLAAFVDDVINHLSPEERAALTSETSPDGDFTITLRRPL